MKKITQMTLKPSVAILLTIYSICGFSQPDVDFSNEPKIKMTDFIKPGEDLEEQRLMFKERVKFVNSTEPVAYNQNIIPLRELITSFYVKAKDAAIAAGHTKFVTGVRIYYGMKNGEVVYFYKPVYAVGKSSKKKFKGEATEVTNKYSIYDKNSAKFIDAPSTEEMNKYTRDVRIRHYKGNKEFTPMTRLANPGHWKNDSEAVLFSFQEIIHWYDKVFPNESPSDRYSQNIGLNNGAANYKRRQSNPFQRQKAKHTIFITKVGAEFESSGLTDGANLGHLCPPSCQDITYPILN